MAGADVRPLFARQSVNVVGMDPPLRFLGGSTGVMGGRRSEAMRHSAVWAALRLRADLISTLPLDVFRRGAGRDVEVETPPVLVQPGQRMLLHEWLYATQVDLDRYGNAFGWISKRDATGRPMQIDLLPAEQVRVRVVGGDVEYRVRGQLVDRSEIWHERQYPIAGLPVGLSPVAFAALTVSMYLSAQEFAEMWFAEGVQLPSGVLRNATKTIDAETAQVVKERFKASVRAGEPFVTGKDWEFDAMQAASNDDAWLSTQQASNTDIARFFGVPSDLIDAAVSGASITYANIAERNLQLLIMNLGAPIARRETALSDLVAPPRFVKLNADALLRMDAKARSELLGQQIKDRMTAPSEARQLMDREPFTEEQYAEFARLFPTRTRQGEPTDVTND